MLPFLIFGEVLVDIFPDKRHIGGAPFNVAFHLHALGIPVCFVSRVGNDETAKEIRGFCATHSFPALHIQTDPEKKSGEVDVSLDANGSPSFSIHTDRAFDRIALTREVKEILANGVSGLYFGTLARRNIDSARTFGEITRMISRDVPTFCDVNIRAPHCEATTVAISIAAATMLKLNDDEADSIEELLFPASRPGNEKKRALFVARLFAQCPDLEIVCITHGADGVSFFQRGEPTISLPSAPVAHFRNTLGAGDAFMAMLIACDLMRMKPKEAVERALRFASAVCTLDGALPSDRSFYSEFLLG